MANCAVSTALGVPIAVQRRRVAVKRTCNALPRSKTSARVVVPRAAKGEGESEEKSDKGIDWDAAWQQIGRELRGTGTGNPRDYVDMSTPKRRLDKEIPPTIVYTRTTLSSRNVPTRHGYAQAQRTRPKKQNKTKQKFHSARGSLFRISVSQHALTHADSLTLSPLFHTSSCLLSPSPEAEKTPLGRRRTK